MAQVGYIPWKEAECLFPSTEPTRSQVRSASAFTGNRVGIPAGDKALCNAVSLNSNRKAAATRGACPINFVEAISSCFRNHANFSGRVCETGHPVGCRWRSQPSLRGPCGSRNISLHQPHRAGTELRRELVACLLAHGATLLQELEPPANPERFTADNAAAPTEPPPVPVRNVYQHAADYGIQFGSLMELELQ